MKMLLLIGFRNLFRNKRRSILTAFVIASGLVSLMMADAFTKGMMQKMIQNQTDLFLGHGQIHHQNFIKEKDISHIIEKPEKVFETLNKTEGVTHYTTRVLAQGMLNSAYHSLGVQVVGVDFSKEKNVSRISHMLTAGDYPFEKKEQTIILGSEVAKKLQVSLDDKIVLTGSPHGDSELFQKLFRVSGIVHFGMRALDKYAIFIDISIAQEIYGLKPQEFHEIALRFDAVERSQSIRSMINKNLENKNNVCEWWGEIVPSLSAMVDMASYSLLYVGIILFIFIFLTIMNTIFMSIMDRSFEFGVIKSLGTRKKMIFHLILSECFFLGLAGSAVGLIIGACSVYYFHLYGISYAEAEFAGISLLEPIRTKIESTQFIQIPLTVLAMTIISGIYPAIYAARLKPLEAMKKAY